MSYQLAHSALNIGKGTVSTIMAIEAYVMMAWVPIVFFAWPIDIDKPIDRTTGFFVALLLLCLSVVFLAGIVAMWREDLRYRNWVGGFSLLVFAVLNTIVGSDFVADAWADYS